MIYRPSRRVQGLVVLAIMGGMFIGARSAASWRPRKIKISKAPILALAFAPKGNELVCATGDGKWQSLSVSSLNVSKSGDGHLLCKVAALSDDGRTLLMTNFTHVKLWRLWPNQVLWQCSYSLPRSESGPFSTETGVVALSGVGNRFSIDETFGNHGSLYVGEIGKNHARLDNEHCIYTDTIEALALSSDGRYVVYGGANVGGVWDAKTRKTLWNLDSGAAFVKGQPDEPTAFRFSPQGRLLAVAYSSLQIHLLDVRTGKLVSPLAGNYSRPILDFTFSPDGQFLAGSNEVGELCI